jgi:hypothetical protein
MYLSLSTNVWHHSNILHKRHIHGFLILLISFMYIQIDSHVELSKVEKQRETIEDEATGRRRK